MSGARAGALPVPSEVGGWDAATARKLADTLQYKRLVAYLVRFLDKGDWRAVDFVEAGPSLHVPVLYYDIRNQLKHNLVARVHSTRTFVASAARVLLMVMRTAQDVLACQDAFGDARWQVAEQLHAKACTWLQQFHVARRLASVAVAAAAAPPSRDATDDSEWVAAIGDGGNDERCGAASAAATSQEDFAVTGWPAEAAFAQVAAESNHLLTQALAATTATGLPLPVWVLAVQAPSLVFRNTIYFADGNRMKQAAARGNIKVDMVRAAARIAVLEAWGVACERPADVPAPTPPSVRTWRDFYGMSFTKGSAFVQRVTQRTAQLCRYTRNGSGSRAGPSSST